MAKWTRNKVNPDNINNGNEYTKDDNVSLEELNAMVDSGLFTQDFVNKLIENIDISEVGNVGTPSVSFVTGDDATSDKPYKKFKFSNLKGEKGEKGDKGDKGDPASKTQISTGSGTAGLSSYWFPVWKQTKAVGNYNEISYLVNVGTAYQNTKNYSLTGMFNFQIRQNNSIESLEIAIKIYSGNLKASDFKVYKNTDGLLELWVNCSGQYIKFSGEVLSMYGLDPNELYNTDPYGTWITQGFTAVQTHTGTDISSSVDIKQLNTCYLYSPVRIWDLADGIYKLPENCVVYYKGATDTTSYTFTSTSLLFVTTKAETRQYTIIGSASATQEMYFSSGYVTESTGNLVHNKMTGILINTDASYTIAGSSTYTGSNKIKATHIDVTTKPSTIQYKLLDFIDKNNTRIGVVGSQMNTGGYYGMYMQAGNKNSIGIFTNGTNVITYAPTPSAGDKSTQIATTAWVKSLATPNLTDTTAHTQTGNAVVVETYLSADKQTWYRKWSDGWKECGIIGTAKQNTALALPIIFSNTNYTSVGSVYNADYQNAIRIEISSTSEIKVTTSVQGQGYYESTVRIYCCGY